MQDFRRLQVWQKAHALTLSVYCATRAFPREEIYGLTSQARRASASIGANIAEGCGRYGDTELSRFLQIAMGSTSELEYHMLLARDLGFFDQKLFQGISRQTCEVKKMLASLIRRLKPLEQ